MPLAVRATAQAQRDLPAWIDRDYRAGICPRFGVRSAAVFRWLRQRNIAHIRARRLYSRRQPDPEEPSDTSCFIAPSFELIIVSDPQQFR
jgi:hypothetical protein